MMRVSNRKAIRRLAWKSFGANRIRNFFAVFAVILTTVLFTSLFTAAIEVNYSFEQQNMRNVGGYAHGNFKYLTEKQVKQLSKHKLIKEFGTSLFLSGLYEGTFTKHTAEIRYFDKNGAGMFFSAPTTGRIPKDKYEIATDTVVLEQLGVKAKLGEKVKITYPLGSKKITDTFTLCGFWKTDKLTKTSQVILSKEYVEEKLKGYQPQNEGDTVGTWDLEYMFHSSRHIENNLRTIAEDSGYQINNPKKDNYLAIGVNWAYTDAQTEHDHTMLYAVIGIAALIIFTGYLIIYNIFLISVANDIRFYGLLKTIGTTGKQIKQILLNQILLLSVFGIPLGLLIGYLIGLQITPIIMSNMAVTTTYQKADPKIFIGAAIFAVLTIILSIRKPSKIASKVSPVEAVRFTEGLASKKLKKQSKHGARLYRMALSNLLRNKKKSILMLISLSLSIVLLNSVYVFSIGFDMNKLINQYAKADFTVAGANYFNGMKGFCKESDALPDNIINKLKQQEGYQGGGKIYYDLNTVLTDFSKKMADAFYSDCPGDVDDCLYHIHGKKSRQGDIQLYGMEDYILNKLEVVEGKLDINKLKTGNYILQITGVDDYNKIIKNIPYFHPGDKVKLYYLDNRSGYSSSKIKYHSKTYEVMAVVKEVNVLSVRYFSTTAFILPAKHFITDSKSCTTMSYIMDAKNSSESAIEQYLKNYTTTNSDISFESKELYRREFNQFKNMFLIIGSGLSIIVGIIGILNFINVILTSIITRRREFSVLKSIGMTGKQLNTMLCFEGLIYAAFTLVISAILSFIVNITVIKAFGTGFWFFTAHNTLLAVFLVAPILIFFSIIVPYVSYSATNKQSIVEQLRVLE